jgi:hypothetical protein
MNTFSIAVDHGLPEPIDWRKILGLTAITNWLNADNSKPDNMGIVLRRSPTRFWKKDVSEDLAEVFGGHPDDYLKRFTY